jgi:hypothetical protein
MFGARPAMALAEQLEALTSDTSLVGDDGSRQTVAGKLPELNVQVSLLLVALSRRDGAVVK